jgi:uncharacterized protein (DUF1810 family)
MTDHNLQRFFSAQQNTYATALEEIKNGKKESHWMWYIFPQFSGLGFSETSKFYAIKDMKEAKAFLLDPVLGKRLIEISTALLQLESNSPGRVFGSPDDMKLKSSMTLFASIPFADPVFDKVLDKFFRGVRDAQTLQVLEKQKS